MRERIPLLFLLAATAVAQEQKPPEPEPFQPDHRQIWVPRDQLDAVLAKFPRAILLNREEYEALVRDAGKTAPEPDAAPPAAAVIERATFEGEVLEDIVRIRANYEVDCLVDEWAEISLTFDPRTLASIEVDETSALRSIPAGKGQTRPALVVRGKGEHTVVAEFHIGIVRNATGQSISIPNPRLAASKLALTFPQKVEIASSHGFSANADGTGAEFEFPPDNSPLKIAWTSRDITSLEGSAIQQICRFNYHLTSTAIEADLGLRLTSELAELPKQIVFNLPPDAEVRNVAGTAVQAWTIDDAGQQLLIDRFPHRKHQLDLQILLDTPSLADEQDELTAALPMVQAEGVFRAEGRLALLAGSAVRVQEISTGPLLNASLLEVESELANRADFVTAFNFPAIGDPPEVTFRRVDSDVHGGLDTNIAILRDGIHLTRALVVQPREGSVFETKITLPENEEIIAVTSATNQLVDWNHNEQLLTLTWRPPPGDANQAAGSGLNPGQTGQAQIQTRIDPDDWYNFESGSFQFGAAETDLDVVYGFVVVNADAAFAIEAGQTEGLENRDGRATRPFTGQLAWERLGPYSLELGVTRREPAIFGQMTAYALPLTNSLEVEGQLFLTVRNSPIRSFEISLPPAVAPLFKADSALISEQQLDEESGIWTLRFHREFEGVSPIRWRMSIPFELTDDEGEKRFSIEVPAIGLPAAKRLFGHWMLEANTDTELSFSAEGLDPVDSLRIPSIAGYLPQHRVIAAYGYRGSDYALTIEGVRHSAEDIVTTIIDDLAVDSVVSTDGVDRHQVQIVVRSAGDQFLEVGLPDGARLWSLLVDHEPVKPVRHETKQSSLRIHLPAHVDSQKAAHIRLIFESDAAAWRGSGRRTLPTIALYEGIPILRSTWQLHLPEGFSYRDFRSNLQPRFDEQPKVLLSYVWDQFRHQQLPEQTAPPQLVALEPDAPFETQNLNPAEPQTQPQEAEPVRPPAGDTADIWLHAYLLMREAEDLVQAKKDLEALAKFRESQKLFDYVSRSHPNWKKSMVEWRRKDLQSKIHEVTQRLEGSGALAQNQPAAQAQPPAAFDTMRSNLNDQIAQTWELQAPIPVPADPGARQGIQYISNRLTQIVIPEVEFNETPVSQAIDFLRIKSIELDHIEPDPAKKGVNIIFRPPLSGEEPRITLKLSNVPLVEAIRYTTDLARMKYSVEPDFIAISPLGELSSGMFTKTFITAPGLFSGDESVQKTLEKAGISFPPGSNVIFNPETSNLTARNTIANLDLIESYLEVVYKSPSGGVERSGLMPLDFQLPDSGQTMTFAGLYAPDAIEFRYVSWEREIQQAWLMILVGAAAFWGFARKRPLFLGLIGIVILTFAPMLSEFVAGWSSTINSLLLGWIGALIIALIWSISRCAIRLKTRAA